MRYRIQLAVSSVLWLVMVVGWNSRAVALPSVKIPTPRMPSPNAHDFYIRAGAALAAAQKANPAYVRVDPVTDADRPPDATPEELAARYPTARKEAWLKTAAPALQLLRQGFKYRYLAPPERSFDPGDRDYYRQFRELARLLAVESHAKAERGDWPGASRSILDIMRFGYDVPRGAPYMGMLVGHGLTAIAARQMQEFIPHLDTATARGGAARMEQLESTRFTYAESVREEMHSGQANLLHLFKVPNWRSTLSAESKDIILSNAALIARRHRFSDQQIIDNYTRYMRAQIAAAKLPYRRRRMPALPADPISANYIQIYKNMNWSAARASALQFNLMVQLALRAYKLEHDKYPASLRGLAPRYLRRVPADPFGAGEPLRYRTKGDEYVLYSIGPDGKDDGGKPIFDAARKASAPLSPDAGYVTRADSKGDFVAGVNR